VADDPAAVAALVVGLNDPDPAVVVEVLDSLEFAGDETVVPHIVPLLEHRTRRFARPRRTRSISSESEAGI
jgi:HEAT repeat protein